jgi:hypothetical protein
MTTGNDKLEQRLSQEDGVSKELSYGIHEDGFQDPTGEYPRRYNWFGSSQPAAGRGVKINELWMSGSVLGASFDIPIATASIYPFNQANETPSGHSFEIDDTPGNERILIKHHTGAGVELKQDGSVLVASRSHQIQVVGADHEVVVQGKGNITYDGDLTMTVNGNYNLNVNGSYNVNVGANHNHSVNDSYIIETGDAHSTIVRGNKDVRVGNDAIEYVSGSKKNITKKETRTITGKDFVVNSKEHVRYTAMKKLTASSGEQMVFTSKKLYLAAEEGKIGGDNFHYMGSLYTGPEDDNGSHTVFQGNLLGRALEAWTTKYAIYAEESHSSHISNFAGIASYADKSGLAGTATVAIGAVTAGMISGGVTPPVIQPPLYPNWEGGHIIDGSDDMVGPAHPNYQWNWGWEAPGNTVVEKQQERMGKVVSPNYVTDKDWFEVWNKTSPYAVRWVDIDPDGTLFDKITKVDTYTYYFTFTPDTFHIRSKLRTMDGASDGKYLPYLEASKCLGNLEKENRMGGMWSVAAPPAPYLVKRTGKSEAPSKYGYTLLGNPVERASKKFTPKNKSATTRTIVADPNYNPDKRDKPITGETKLSKASTVGKFLGAPGSKASMDYIPNVKDRQDLARQWYLHAWLMEGISAAKEFRNHRLQVTEGYYHPASGVNELYMPAGAADSRYWREPYLKEDGGGCQASIVRGAPFINELKHNGRAVVYTLYNSRGKVDYSAGFELALYIRDTFFFDQLSLDYDLVRPDDIMSQQLIVVMPEIKKDFKATFGMKTCTYFNRKMFDGGDLVEITD